MPIKSKERIRIRSAKGKITGPYFPADILNLVRSGKLEGDEEIFLESEGRWKAIAAEPEFFDLIQEVVLGVRYNTRSVSRGSEKVWTASFDKKPSGSPDATERLPPTPIVSEATKASTIQGTSRLPSSSTTVTSQGSRIQNNEENNSPDKPPTLRGFEDLRIPEAKADKRRALKIILIVLLILLGLLSFLPVEIGPKDLAGIKLEFNLKKGYFRPLLLRLRLLGPLSAPPEKLSADAQTIKVLPLNLHDLMLKLDELQRDPASRTAMSQWFYKAWTYRILGDALSAGDSGKGAEFRSASDSILDELRSQGLLNAELEELIESLDLLLGGEIGKSVESLKSIKNPTLVSQIFQREVTYWATLGGLSAATDGDLAFDELSDLNLKYQYEEDLRQRAKRLDFETDFLKAAENVLNQDSHSLIAWYLLSRFYSEKYSGNPTVPNRFFFTGLTQLSLWPRTLQAMYWRSYAQFFNTRDPEAAKRMTQAAEAIEQGGFDRDTKVLDIDDQLFRFSTLLETYRKQFETNEMNPTELASFELLSEASTDPKGNLVSVMVAPILEKNWAVADRKLRLIEKTFPFDFEIKTLRIWVEGERFRFENAQALLASSFSGASGEAIRAEGILRALGRDYEGARRELTKFLEKNAQDSLTLYFLSRVSFESEKYLDCVRYSQLGQLNSVGPMKLKNVTMNFRCRVLASLGVDAAIREFGDFVSRFPHTSLSREEYIRALLDADRSREAMRLAESDVVENPRVPSLKVLLGEVYERRGMNDEALALYNDARRIDPRNMQAALHVADLFYKQRRYKEAAENYVAAGALDFEIPELFLKAARAYRSAGKLDLAQEMYFKEVSLRPAVLDTFLEAAEFLLEANRPAYVPELFQKFNEAFRSDSRILTRLAQAYFAMGDPKNARINAELAVRLNPTEAEPYRILGMLFESQGAYPLSKANYEKYLVLLPQAPEAENIKTKLSMPPYSSP